MTYNKKWVFMKFVFLTQEVNTFLQINCFDAVDHSRAANRPPVAGTVPVF